MKKVSVFVFALLIVWVIFFMYGVRKGNASKELTASIVKDAEAQSNKDKLNALQEKFKRMGYGE